MFSFQGTSFLLLSPTVCRGRN